MWHCDNCQQDHTDEMTVCPKSMVDHPPHYNTGNIEVIDAIEDWGCGFNDGNAIKYVARHRHKGKPVEDLKKARWYIDREISRLEGADA